MIDCSVHTDYGQGQTSWVYRFALNIDCHATVRFERHICAVCNRTTKDHSTQRASGINLRPRDLEGTCPSQESSVYELVIGGYVRSTVRGILTCDQNE